MNTRRALTAAIATLALVTLAGTALAERVPRVEIRAGGFVGGPIQGGLVLGRVQGRASATLNGKPLRIAPGGYFVFGLPRDAKPQAVLQFRWASGDIATRTLKVKQRTYRIQRIGGLAQKYVREIDPNSPLYKRLEREYFLVKAARDRVSDLPYYRRPFIWPAKGRISGVYGSQRILNGKPRRPHYGVDVAAPAGTPVVAPQGGIVALTHPGLYFAGKTIILDHGQGVSTTYIHLSRISVKKGQRVKRGQLIGRIGTTGRSTGPHLHWGLNWGEMYLDPRTMVGAMRKKK